MGSFLIALAFFAGQHATRDLTWGPFVDMDRDASFAQGLLEGHYGEDPLYRGEVLWFTPMYFTLEAALSDALGLSIQVVQAKAGAYLNLLAPIAFFLMVWRFFGPLVALGALMVHLFLVPGQEPGWAVATYSPWSIPVSFFHGLFYLMMIVLHKAFRSSSPTLWMITGAAAGVIFLGHAAPAMIVVALIVVHVVRGMFAAWRARDTAALREHLFLGILAGTAFIVVSLPLTWYVIGDYGLDQRNRVPTAFTYHPLAWRNRALFLYHNLTWSNALGLAGLFLLVRTKPSLPRSIVLTWMGIAVFFAVFTYTAVILAEFTSIRLPASVPTFHFYFYLKGALAICAGYAIVALAHGAVLLHQRKGNDATGPARTTLLVSSLVVFITTAIYPSYAHRMDLDVIRQRCLHRMADTEATEMVAYLRDQLPWEAVVLCDDELSMWVVMASARKTVATNASMANPYVPPGPREEAREALLQALADPDKDVRQLMKAYDVSYVLVRVNDMPRMTNLAKWFPRKVHANGRYVLFARP